MRSYVLFLLLSVFLAVFSTGCGKSGVQAARENDLTPQKILSVDDQKFLDSAEKSGIRQNTMAQEAIRRSKNAEVQAFATKVTNDMSVVLTELKDLMKAKHLGEPAAFAEEAHSETVARLKSVSDDAFDREFVSLMTVEAQETARMFDSAAQTAADPDVRKYAMRNLAAVQANYDKATELQTKLMH